MLEMLVAEAGRFPAFRLERGVTVREVVRDDRGRVVGVRLDSSTGSREVRGDLVVGTDGRASVLRVQAGLHEERLPQAFDIVWCKVPQPAFLDRGTARAYLGDRHFALVFPSYDDRLQIGWVIEEGSFPAADRNRAPPRRPRVPSLRERRRHRTARRVARTATALDSTRARAFHQRMNATRLETFLQQRTARRLPARAGVAVVDLPRAAMRVRVAGRGRHTVAILPDPPNVIEHYDRLIELLAPDVGVVCFEAPGFGFSTAKPDFDFTLDTMVGTIAALLARLELGPYVLVFPCFAGLAAVRLAAHHPELVSHLVLVQTPAWPEEIAWVRRVDARGWLQTPVVGQLLMSFGKRRVARGWYHAALPSGADPAPFLRPALDAFDAGAAYCLASTFQAAARQPEPRLGVLRQPALVVWGDADRTHRRTDKRSILAHVPHADWAQFDAAGHFPDLEQPERFRDELLNFLR
jgi:pimeloyl-ACP methyl ester carboxylesterase